MSLFEGRVLLVVEIYYCTQLLCAMLLLELEIINKVFRVGETFHEWMWLIFTPVLHWVREDPPHV